MEPLRGSTPPAINGCGLRPVKIVGSVKPFKGFTWFIPRLRPLHAIERRVANMNLRRLLARKGPRHKNSTILRAPVCRAAPRRRQRRGLAFRSSGFFARTICKREPGGCATGLLRLVGDGVTMGQPSHSATHPPHDEQRSSIAVSPLVTFMVLRFTASNSIPDIRIVPESAFRFQGFTPTNSSVALSRRPHRPRDYEDARPPRYLENSKAVCVKGANPRHQTTQPLVWRPANNFRN